jgi:hypothetical protein
VLTRGCPSSRLSFVVIPGFSYRFTYLFVTKFAKYSLYRYPSGASFSIHCLYRYLERVLDHLLSGTDLNDGLFVTISYQNLSSGTET